MEKMYPTMTETMQLPTASRKLIKQTLRDGEHIKWQHNTGLPAMPWHIILATLALSAIFFLIRQSGHDWLPTNLANRFVGTPGLFWLIAFNFAMGIWHCRRHRRTTFLITDQRLLVVQWFQTAKTRIKAFELATIRSVASTQKAKQRHHLVITCTAKAGGEMQTTWHELPDFGTPPDLANRLLAACSASQTSSPSQFAPEQITSRDSADAFQRLPGDLQQRLKAILMRDENVHWFARPDPALAEKNGPVRLAWVLKSALFVSTILLMTYILLIVILNVQMAIFVALAITIGGTLLSFLLMELIVTYAAHVEQLQCQLQEKNTFYLMTNRRAIIVTNLKHFKSKSYLPQHLADMQCIQKTATGGDLIFEFIRSDDEFGRQLIGAGFLNLDNVHDARMHVLRHPYKQPGMA